jgi:hypothetical protein
MQPKPSCSISCRFLFPLIVLLSFFSVLYAASGTPEISLTPTIQQVGEGDTTTTATVMVTLSESPAQKEIVLHLYSYNGTATTSDNDYVSIDRILTFPVGGPLSQTVSITINGDSAYEGDEEFYVTVQDGGTNPAQAFTFGTKVAVIIIRDDTSDTVYSAEHLCYGPPTETCLLELEELLSTPLVGPLLETLLEPLPDDLVDLTGGVLHFACELIGEVEGILDRISATLPLVDLGSLEIVQKTTIPINHLNDTPLTEVDVILDKEVLSLDLDAVDWCGVDGSPGSCIEQSALGIGLGSLGLLDVIDRSVVYNMPDMAPDDANHSILLATVAGIDVNALLFGGAGGTLLYGRYIKDGLSHVGPLTACGSGGYAPPEAPTTIADVVDFNENTSAAAYNGGEVKYIGTKVANKDDYYFDAVYLGNSGNTAETYPASRSLNLSVYVELANDSCTETYDFAGDMKSTAAEIEPGSDHATTLDPLRFPAYARKAMRLSISAIDWEAQFETYGVGQQCFVSSLHGNLCEVYS